MDREHIEIVEVGPRDGLQSESRVLPTAAKLEFIRRLAAAGLPRIEVASFVNPKRVPQMADAEEVMAALAPMKSASRFIGLVLNRRGFERAQAAGCGEVGMAIAASESFSQRNQGCSVEEGLAGWLEIARLAREAGIRAQLTISTAFGCPFEGEVAAERVVRLAERAAAGSPVEISVADTIGVAVPTQVSGLLRQLRAALPQMRLRAQYRAGQCLRRDRERRARAGCELRRHRRLPIRAGSHRQHPHRGSDLHASSHGIRDGRRPARAARYQPLAATNSRARCSRHARQGRAVPGNTYPSGDPVTRWLYSILIAVSLSGCGKTPIEEAVGKNDRQAVAEAIKAGADVNARTFLGDTPLLLAAKSAQSSSAQALIEGGADIQVRDEAGNSVLHYAAASGMTGICGLLIDRGLAVDTRGLGGATPLQFAAQGGRQETAKYLVRRGASLEQKNAEGASVLDLVTASGDERFANDLKLAAATRTQ